MEAYVYKAELYCLACGHEIVTNLMAENNCPANTLDESSYDSDDFPKGPYPNGGGSSDTPQHCAKCGVFLENPLTTEGVDYVREVVNSTPRSIVAKWKTFYRDQIENKEPARQIRIRQS